MVEKAGAARRQSRANTMWRDHCRVCGEKDALDVRFIGSPFVVGYRVWGEAKIGLEARVSPAVGETS